MPVALHPDLREAAKTLYVQGVGPSQISKQLSVKEPTLWRWINRHNWVELRTKTYQALQEKKRAVAEIEHGKISDKARQALASALLVQAEVIANQAVTYEGMRNTPEGQGLAAVTKTVVESNALIHGWGSEKTGTIIVVDDLRSFDKEVKTAQVTDIQDVK